MLWFCLSRCSGSSASVIDQALLDEDANNVFVFFVQDSHDVGYRKPVIDEEIADGDFPFRNRVKGS